MGLRLDGTKHSTVGAATPLPGAAPLHHVWLRLLLRLLAVQLLHLPASAATAHKFADVPELQDEGEPPERTRMHLHGRH